MRGSTFFEELGERGQKFFPNDRKKIFSRKLLRGCCWTTVGILSPSHPPKLSIHPLDNPCWIFFSALLRTKGDVLSSDYTAPANVQLHGNCSICKGCANNQSSMKPSNLPKLGQFCRRDPLLGQLLFGARPYAYLFSSPISTQDLKKPSCYFRSLEEFLPSKKPEGGLVKWPKLLRVTKNLVYDRKKWNYLV